MAIITISRGTFAGGQELANLVAASLQYRAVSREEVYDTVERKYGFTLDQAARLLEDAPNSRSELVAQPEHRRSLGAQRRRLFAAVQAALCELVGEDSVVYHGYAGHLLLSGVPHVLRVRLIAPRGQRIEMAMRREELARTAASRKIDQVDQERARWTQSFFGATWGDPLMFDVVLNLENLTTAEAADIVVHAASLAPFRATDDARKRLADLTLASRVAAQLFAESAFLGVPRDVRAEDGVVTVLGVAEQSRPDVTSLVERMTGVRSLHFGP